MNRFSNQVPAFLSWALMLATVAGCSPRVISVPVRDSLTISEKETVTFVPVEIPLPTEFAQKETRDTFSILETSVAVSEAVVSGGVLKHTLRNKEESVKAEVKSRDRVVTEYRVKEVPIPVEVEKPYTPEWVWWVLGWAVLSTGLIVLGIVLRARRV